MNFPTLATDRLVMRAVRAEDRADWERLTGDVRVWRYISPEPLTPAESWSKLLMKSGSWDLLGLGNWAVCDKADGTLLGEIGFFDALRASSDDLSGAIEVGWSYFPNTWGQGIATEASLAAHRWLDEARPNLATFCIINAENAGSLRVAEKSGYSRLRVEEDERGVQHILRRNPARG